MSWHDAMPELPDVCAYLEGLERHVVGRPLEQVKVLIPFLLRSYDPPLDAVFGKTVRGVRRIGKRIVLVFDDGLFIVMHLMIAGRLHWRRAGARLGMGGKITVATFHFEHGILHFTEAGTRKRASLLVVRGDEALRALDPDILRAETGEGFPEDVTAFRKDMAVHGKYKLPCPVCGSPVQRIVYAQNECNYCATWPSQLIEQFDSNATKNGAAASGMTPRESGVRRLSRPARRACDRAPAGSACAAGSTWA